MGTLKFTLIALAGLWVGFAGYRQYEATQLHQPYAFNHAAHRVMKCVLCHEGAIDGIKATLPPMETCLKCHAQSPLTDTKSVAAWNKAVEDGGFRWKKLTSVPSYVFFSHRRHTNSGKLECVRCHSDMQDLQKPPALPLERVSMSACISCHRENTQTDDCAHCHK